MSKDAYWCELAWLGEGQVQECVLVEVAEREIVLVQAGSANPPAGATALHGLTIPGLANAHSHAFHRALRGRTQSARGGSFWTWREQMYRVAAKLDPDSYYALARATYGEMALAGITAVGEFHYLHHGPGGTRYDDANALGRALIQAADDAGLTLTLLDACYLGNGIDGVTSPTQERFFDPDVDAWVARVEELHEDSGVRIGAAIHSVRAVDPQSAGKVADFARRRGCPLHAHVSEQPAENERCLTVHGATPTAVLADVGALDEAFTAVHFTHVADEDVRLLGRARACCCLCPTTERDLADGVGRADAIAEAGASLALGSDSHAVIDPFEEARAVELDQRLLSGERGHHRAATLLKAATEGGHRCLGDPTAGRLAPGCRADLVTIGLDSVRLAGTTIENALESVLFAAAAADVSHVVSAGRTVVDGGRHLSIDVPAELRESIAAVWR